jgi:predicted AAA+ superfamily ATPase
MLPLTTQKEIILRNREFFLKKESLIPRNINIKKILKTKQITVITGIRRCGKSTLLKIIKNQIKEENIYYLNFNDPLLTAATIEDIQHLFDTYFSMYPSTEKHIFLDEVQEIKGWHKFILQLYEEKNKVIITGSNGNLLSKEIATYLTGRHEQIILYPFSFNEYLTLKKISYEKNKATQAPLLRAFETYTNIGGFPQVIKDNNKEYLKEYYESIIYRDVIVRNNVSYAKEIKELAHYIISNNTKMTSYTKLKTTINVKSTSTIKEYLDYINNAFIILPLNKFDYSIKIQLRTSKKMYCIDTGMAQIIGFKFSENKGQILENTVFIELKRREHEIYYHKEKKECDFVIYDKGKITQAIQVCYELHEDNKKREFEGLLEAMKKYKLKEGLLLTNDEEEELVLEGKKIHVLPVWKWLLSEGK